MKLSLSCLFKKDSTIIGNLIFIFIVGLQFIGVDYLINYMTHFYNPSVHPSVKIDLKLIYFVIALSFFRSTKAIVIIQSFFAVLIYFQSVHYMYYGFAIVPSEVHEFFTSFVDVINDFGMLKNFMWLSVLPVLLIALGTFTSLYFGRKRIRIPYIWAVLIIVIFFIGLNIAKPRSTLGERASRHNNIYHNTLNFLLRYFTHELPDALGIRKDLATSPYSHTSYKLIHKNKDIQLIIIQGESLTFHHMHLYGYERRNTPFLSKLANKKFVRVYKGVPLGPATDVTLPEFYNLIPHPNGINQILSGRTNLFKMAKTNNFITTFISIQSALGLKYIKNYLGVKYINEYGDSSFFGGSVYDDDSSHTIKDASLIGYLHNHVNFKKRNFLVLHMYGSHSPYPARYPEDGFDIYKNQPGDSFRQKQINEYDNSVRYTDYIIQKLYEYIKAHTHRPTYIVFTSDHGEGLGEQRGYFGHGNNQIQHVVHVPIIIIALHGADLSFLKSHKQQPRPDYMSHFELAKIIGYMLGYQTKPLFNQAKGYIINGGNLDGSEGFRKLMPNDFDAKPKD